MKPFDAFQGETITFTSPSGKSITIREMTGDDEDIVTRRGDAKTGKNLENLVAALVVSPKVTSEEVGEWRVRDKYYTVFQAIKLTHGPTLRFTHEFSDGSTVAFEEDLDIYDLGHENEQSCKTYIQDGDPHIFEVLDKGKRYQFGFYHLTSKMESALLTVPQEEMSLNDMLRDRKFFEVKEGSHLTIENFRVYSARVLAKIRSEIMRVDGDWRALITLVNPATKNSETISIFSIDEFFFPKY